jgi:hypothetical protein
MTKLSLIVTYKNELTTVKIAAPIIRTAEIIEK